MNINGLELPAALAANLGAADYKLTASQRACLRKEMKWLNNPEPELYNHRSILRENRAWASDGSEQFLGTPSLQYAPGNVERKLTLLIGDTGPDSPIALDYRTTEPQVVYLCGIDRVEYWVELCPSYEALMKMIEAA